jgi:hypothetical protein
MSAKTFKIARLAALAALAAGAVSAFVLLSPARTWDSPPTYIVDNRGLDSVTDSDGGVAATVAAVESSIAWNGAGVGTVVQATAGSVAGFSLGDGVPMLNFDDPLNACTGNCLAATFTGFYSQRGDGSYRIDDADIVTNTAHSWTSQAEDAGGAGCSGEFYIEGVQVHEVGHGLGLGHSNVSGATMYPSVASCNNGPASIAADDAAGINALYGDSGGGGGAPCTGCTQYSGSLSGSGDSDVQPNGGSYRARSGTHRGYLRGPGNADFDLYLQRRSFGRWQTVASGTGASSDEDVIFNGSNGTYRWVVNSYTGSGSYDFYLDPP